MDQFFWFENIDIEETESLEFTKFSQIIHQFRKKKQLLYQIYI